MSEHILIINTCPDKSTAETMAIKLIDMKLAACVNVLPGIRSIYRWQGKRETVDEHLLIIKTQRECYDRVQDTLRAHHPYELPEIIAVPIVEGLTEYLKWMDEQCKN
ncbi:MAG TPA: divalent-cation tolerance protein CutA [Gammaproteobacteria bacterium]|nr:divalent-cation tolerance protein CutA [Gammaproteobacteria bacterium]